MAKQSFKLRVNGSEYEVFTETNRPLLDVVREDLGLTGSKEGCGTGDCGACTMLLDGAPVTTCLVLVGEAENRDITTVEGIAKNGQLHPVQAAFVEFGALQCGFCIPGMIVSSVALLDRNPHPTEEEIRYGIAGNLCRCTGYTKIVEAIQAASSRM